MIKGTTRSRTYRAIYRLLDRVSPVPFDCGQICGAACCTAAELDDELGILLLPGSKFFLVLGRDEDGTLEMVFNDYELPYACPMIEEETELDQRFVQATYTVWKHLIRDPLIYDLVAASGEE